MRSLAQLILVRPVGSSVAAAVESVFSRTSGMVLAMVHAMVLAMALPGSVGALTISEIMYNPSFTDESGCGGCNLEWIEIYNEDPTVVDLSGYRFSNGVFFTFPPDTYLEGRSHLVVCADEDAVRAKYGITNTIGNFIGRLDNDGERISIDIFAGGPVFAVSYGDRNQWPAEADGTGHSLVLKDAHASDPGNNDNWTFSEVKGGTPGLSDFEEVTVRETEIFSAGSVWKYNDSGSDLGTAWREPDFNDASWDSGRAQLGYGDGDEATELSFGGNANNKRTTYYFRATFEIVDREFFDSLVFRFVGYEGAVVYINGTEIGRENMPNGDIAFDTFANGAIGGGDESTFNGMGLASSLLVNGINTFAVEIHQANLTSSDISFDAQIVGVEVITPAGGGVPVPVIINECLARTAGERWVELHNTSDSTVDLGGFWLSRNRAALDGYELPAASSILAGGFLVITETASGLAFDGADLSLFLTRPDLSQVVDAAVFENSPDQDPSLDGYSDARVPDGTGRFSVSSNPTPGAANQAALIEDLVINEIMFHPPREHPTLEYVELFNRGAEALDIGGFRINRGVSFVFPAGTVVAAGEYLVVAQDPESLQNAHGIRGVLGPWQGSLSDRDEVLRVVDSVGNVVDEVHYYDGGYWTRYADGGGSSLELIDARNDNSVAAAWGDSDESDKSSWEEVQFSIGYSSQSESEFQIRLLQAGECLIDSIRVTRGNTQFVPNGDFESNTSGWIIEGTHIDSRRTTSDAFTGNASLHVLASSKGDTRANRIERETSPRMSSGTYTVRYAARWIAGGNLLYISGYNQPPQFQHTRWLDIPSNIGTPGARNSISVPNQGPVIDLVSHSPAVPSAGVEPWVTARVSDADGVTRVLARYHVGTGAYAAREMFDDGEHNDGDAGDGVFAGRIPAQSSGSKVGFYIEARDAAGRDGFFPRETTDRPLVYMHSSPFTARGVAKRLVMDDATWSVLGSRRIHSNHLLNATFVMNDSKVYYNVGTRWRGSPWHRPANPRMYRVKFNKDRRYRQRNKINLTKYGSQQREKAAYYAVWKNSTSSVTCPKSLTAFGRLQTNGGTFTMDQLEPIDQSYLNLWWPDDSDGYAMKITAKLIFNDSVSNFNPSWASYADRGTSKANYRWNFNPRTRELEDNFAPLRTLIQTMNGSSSVLDNDLPDIMDVEQFLRVYAARCAHDDWDTIGIGNGQNAYVYYAPIEGRWKLLPWDLDHSWANAGARIYPDGESRMARILERPQYRRMYKGILNEMVNGVGGRPGFWTVGEMVQKYLDRNTAAVGADGVSSSSSIRSFINSRIGRLRDQIPARITFSITTNNGNPLTIDETSTTLRGRGWVDVHTIVANLESLEVRWVSESTWAATVEVDGGENEIDLIAFDSEGNIVGTDSITITSSVGWAAPQIGTIDPDEGLPGDRVTIRGVGFHNGIDVFFGARRGSNVEYDEFGPQPDSLTVVLPSGLGSVDVTVRNTDGRESNTLPFTYLPPPPEFLRGDANRDGRLDISDPTKIAFGLFAGQTLQCEDAADVDDSESLDVTDIVYLLDYLYRNGPVPPAPYPELGQDPAGETLDCES